LTAIFLMGGTVNANATDSPKTDSKPASPFGDVSSKDARPPTVTGRHGMVTGTTGAAAIAGGVEVLKQGGSAADAAMATAMTQICMAAGSWVSYAGILTMVYFDAASGKTYNLNAAYNTVKGETDPK